ERRRPADDGDGHPGLLVGRRVARERADGLDVGLQDLAAARRGQRTREQQGSLGRSAHHPPPKYARPPRSLPRSRSGDPPRWVGMAPRRLAARLAASLVLLGLAACDRTPPAATAAADRAGLVALERPARLS